MENSIFDQMDTIALQKATLELKKHQDFLIIVHNYQPLEIQEIADYVGDSLEMAKFAAKSNYRNILVCGIRIMAETAKILSPGKNIYLAHPEARCPLAEMKNIDELIELKNKHPEAEVVCYVNSTSDLKAESTVTCTSGNTCQIINAIPEEKEIIFIPDNNLGAWTAHKTGRKLIMWDGYCDVHDQITLEDARQVKAKNPEHHLIVHPECTLNVCLLAEEVLSTSQMIEYVTDHDKVIIGTEIGLYRQLHQNFPSKDLIPLSSKMNCVDMQINSLLEVVRAMQWKTNEIILSEKIYTGAKDSLNRMFSMLEKIKKQ